MIVTDSPTIWTAADERRLQHAIDARDRALASLQTCAPAGGHNPFGGKVVHARGQYIYLYRMYRQHAADLLTLKLRRSY